MSGVELSALQTDFNIWYGSTIDLFQINGPDADSYYEIRRRNDPVNYVSGDTVPTLIIHGLDDSIYDSDQSDILETKLIEYDIDYEYYQIVGGNHGLSSIPETEQGNICDKIATFANRMYS